MVFVKIFFLGLRAKQIWPRGCVPALHSFRLLKAFAILNNRVMSCVRHSGRRRRVRDETVDTERWMGQVPRTIRPLPG